MEALLEIGKQVPALFVLVCMCHLFLKHMSESRQEFLSKMGELHDENVEARVLLRDVIKDNTSVGRVTNDCLINMTSAIKALENEIQRQTPHGHSK